MTEQAAAQSAEPLPVETAPAEEVLHPTDEVSYARFGSHFTPPPNSALKPLCGVNICFEKIEGERMESVNATRLLSEIHTIPDQSAAAHHWGIHLSGKKDYRGFNRAVTGEIEGLHLQNDVANVSLQVRPRAEHGNRAHCDMKMVEQAGVTKNDRNLLRQAVCLLFERIYISHQS